MSAQSSTMSLMTTTDINIIPIQSSDLQERLNRRSSRSRYSKGFKVVTQFLDNGAVAAAVQAPNVLERNKILASSKAFIASSQGDNVTVWAKVGGPTEILLVNLAKADAATKSAYANRPKVGRTKGGKVKASTK